MDWFSIIAGIASLLSFVAFLYEKTMRRKAREEEQRRIWSDISKVKGIMNDIEVDLAKNPMNCGALQAHGALATMLRDLLKEAAHKEKKFSINTIRQWRSTGKLSSDWQEKLALTLLLTREVDSKVANSDELTKFRDWDAVSSDHPVWSARTLEYDKQKDEVDTKS